MRVALIVLLFVLIALLPARAKQFTVPTKPGARLQAVVLHVVDGDTVDVIVKRWTNTPLEHATIRINGIDTAEIEMRLAKCPQEIVKGQQAKAFAQSLMPSGANVIIVYRGHDKYFRVDADVILPNGQNYASVVLSAGLAQPYDGGKKPNWCN